MSFRTAAIGLTSLLLVVVIVGCGGGKPAKEPAADTEDAGAPAEDTASTPPPDPPKDEPAEEPVGCKVLSSCTQVMASGAGVAAAKEKCLAAKGEAVDGGCSKDDLLATCELSSNGAIIYTYASKSGAKNRGLLKGAGDSCKKAEGTFTPAERPKAAGKRGGGKKKKK